LAINPDAPPDRVSPDSDDQLSSGSVRVQPNAATDSPAKAGRHDRERRLPQSLVALQYRNFRLIWIGLFLSFTGSLMQNTALLWHVSLLVSDENKGLALGFVGLTRVAPVVVFSMVSGVLADAIDRRRLLLVTQTLAAIVALALAVLSFRGVAALWPIYVLAALSAAVGAFDLPARQALVPTLVPREHLPNAISLQTIMFQTASVVGPALGGIVIAAKGVAWAYLSNAVSFGFVIVALLMMRDLAGAPVREARARDALSWAAAREGLRFVFRSPLIRSTMVLDFLATFFASATALLPIFAQDILQVGARGYGWLFAAPAVGAMITGVALVPLLEHIKRRGLSIVWSVLGHGAATVIFGLSRSFWLTFVCLAAVGATDTVSTVLRNIIRQLETPDRLRGRMTGVNMVFFMGGPQLGELEAGLVANWFGAPLSVISGGIGCLLTTAAIAAATPPLRRYRSDMAPDAPPE
jgi:MFS family permease